MVSSQLSAVEDPEAQTPERGFEHINLQLNIVDLFFKSPGPPKRLLHRQSRAINPCSLVSAPFVSSSMCFVTGSCSV